MKKTLLLALVFACSLQAKVLATFNGGEVSEEEVASIMRGVLAQQQHQLSKEDVARLTDRAVESIISTKLVLQLAQNSGLTKSAEFQQALENAKNGLTLQFWERSIFEGIKVSDNELHQLYNQNKDKMLLPAQVKAKHILVSSQKEATDLIRQIKSKSGATARIAEFEKLAKSHSIDKGSGAQGGDLGWFEQGKMVPEFSKAAFSMGKGTISNSPVKSQFGYHIIYKEDARESKPISFEEIKPQLEAQIRQNKMPEIIEAQVEELRKKANIKKQY